MGAHTLMVPKVKRRALKVWWRRVDIGDVLLFACASAGVWLASILLYEMTRWRW